MKLSTKPYKGSRDFYPEEMQVRNYIFNTFKKVCKKYGYQEYDGPFIESTDIYKAKSGTEIVNEQLYSFIDKGDREIAIRPEMTPTLSRMVSAKYKELNKPIRWFSIPNLWRYEKPQKGRLREHYQLNVDIYGEKSINAEAEILMIVIDILRQFGATKEMFKVRINNRKLMHELLEKLGIKKDKHQAIFKIIDKKEKVSKQDFIEMLVSKTKLSKETSDKLCHYIETPSEVLDLLGDMSNNVREVKYLLNTLRDNELLDYVKFDPTIIRGLDYYTSFVFELFDLHKDNNRALCGGGKYEGLLNIFINEPGTAVGFGMGDVTIHNFLQTHNLLPDFNSETEYLVTVWPDEQNKYTKASFNIANLLRKNEHNTILWLDNNTKIDKQLKFALKNNISKIIIIGENELKNNSIAIKDLNTKDQKVIKIDQFYEMIKK